MVFAGHPRARAAMGALLHFFAAYWENLHEVSEPSLVTAAVSPRCSILSVSHRAGVGVVSALGSGRGDLGCSLNAEQADV